MELQFYYFCAGVRADEGCTKVQYLCGVYKTRTKSGELLNSCIGFFFVAVRGSLHVYIYIILYILYKYGSHIIIKIYNYINKYILYVATYK